MATFETPQQRAKQRQMVSSAMRGAQHKRQKDAVLDAGQAGGFSNQAMQHLLNVGVIQAKLKVSQPDDEYEKEADRVADMVMRIPDRRYSEKEEKEEKKSRLLKTCCATEHKIQNSVLPHAEGAVIAASNSTGQSLPSNLCSKFEHALGVDLSAVRIYTGPESVKASKAICARGYTSGTAIHFNQGQYNPESAEGQHLLAHEIFHTVQQGGVTIGTKYITEESNQRSQARIEGDFGVDRILSSALSLGNSYPAAAMAPLGVMRSPNDQEMKNAAKVGSEDEANDIKVQVIFAHSMVADQEEAKQIIRQISSANEKIKRHPISEDLDLLKENEQARFSLEQYLATVSDSGNFQSQFATSYMQTKKDYGEFDKMWHMFGALGGSLEPFSQRGGIHQLENYPSFTRAYQTFTGVRNELMTDHQMIISHQTEMEKAKAGLMSTIYMARSKVAYAKAKDKQTEKDAIITQIDKTVSLLMTIGNLAAIAMTGIVAMGNGVGGIDFSKIVESSPEIAPSSLATNSKTGTCEINIEESATPASSKPDTTTYSFPSQTIANLKGLKEKGVNLAGGPSGLIKSAITMLEKSEIDSLSAQISAAQEEGNLNAAAADASLLDEKRKAYQAKILILSGCITNLMNHKNQMDHVVQEMIDIAQKHNASKDLTGGLRLVGSGDKFLSQIQLTINLGEQQQTLGRDALAKRGAINFDPYAPSGDGHAQGPGQLHWWSVEYKSSGSLADRWLGTRHWQKTKHQVELKATGKDSLTSGIINSTQFDVCKAIEELKIWQVEVTAKRDKAQEALGLSNPSGKSS